MQNSNNTIWNIGATAELDVGGRIEINSDSSKLINDQGSVIASLILVQGSSSVGAVCSTNESCFTFNNVGNAIVNNFVNAWVFSGNGQATVRYNGNAELNDSFTSFSNILICGSTGSTTSGISDFGAATISPTSCSPCSIVLPVELINFSAIAWGERQVKLNWQTASEINNDYFTIERSQNGLEWGEVMRIDGTGNSSSPLGYSTIDAEPHVGLSYYRLKQTDFDGKFKYSLIRSVGIEKLTNLQIELHPNPVSIQIVIRGDSSELEEITIYTMLGQDVTLLAQKIERNDAKLVLNISQLSPGIYYIKTKTAASKIYKQ
jgi:hypothetical protein